ncbi:heme exporter protein CcmD [Roseovarius sp. C7]
MLASYAASITLILVLVGLSILRARRVRAALDTLEERSRQDG